MSADLPPWHTPYGNALRDYHRGDADAEMILHSSLGEHEAIPVSVFFRPPEEFFDFEAFALELCHGRVLDLGAGTGVHSLPLQARGFEVTAVEIVPEAMEILRERGVRRVVEGDYLELALPSADTLLMMMNGIGPVGTLAGLDRFLERADRLLAPGGQILVDSGEAVPQDDSGVEFEPPWPIEPGGYPGEAWIQLEYRGVRGTPFRELYVEAETLVARVRRSGWECDVVFEGEYGGGFLARITRPG